jgi:prepilin-type N-terminal cleavage/methylation domain-containing protein
MSSPSRTLRRRPSGFTLIELLISLVILGLVMTLVYTAFGQISGPAVKLRDQLTEQQELRLLMRMVADDLQSAQWLERYWAKSSPTAQYRTGIIALQRFEGTKQYTAISFHAARPARFFRTVDPADDPDLHEVGYFVQPSEDQSQMVLIRREDFYIDDDIENGGVTVQLADHIKTFQVQFLPVNADPNADPPPWQDSWDSSQLPDGSRMPLAMKLTIERTAADGRTLSESLEFNLPVSLKL